MSDSNAHDNAQRDRPARFLFFLTYSKGIFNAFKSYAPHVEYYDPHAQSYDPHV